MSSTVTTFSDRILLRWVPLAVFLAAAVAVGLSIGPHPYGYHAWPRPVAQAPLERTVRTPDSAQRAVVRRVDVRHPPTQLVDRLPGHEARRQAHVSRPRRVSGGGLKVRRPARHSATGTSHTPRHHEAHSRGRGSDGSRRGAGSEPAPSTGPATAPPGELAQAHPQLPPAATTK